MSCVQSSIDIKLLKIRLYILTGSKHHLLASPEIEYQETSRCSQKKPSRVLISHLRLIQFDSDYLHVLPVRQSTFEKDKSFLAEINQARLFWIHSCFHEYHKTKSIFFTPLILAFTSTTEILMETRIQLPLK